MRPHVEFVEVGGSDVAVSVLDGDGERDIVVLFSGVMPMGAVLDDPVTARLIDGFRRLGRVIMFDRRGVGQSDRPNEPGIGRLECWADDLEAVLRSTGAVDPVVVGHSSSAAAAVVVAARTELIGSLVLCEPINPRLARSPDSARRLESVRLRVEEGVDIVDVICPGRIGDPGFRNWWIGAGHMGAGPAAAQRLTEDAGPDELDLIDRSFALLAVPSLVLRQTYSMDPAERAYVDECDEALGVTERRLLDGSDWLMLHGSGVDDIVAAATEFVTGTASAPVTTRSLRAVLFTDLGGSTETLQRLGDQRWRMLIDRHDNSVNRAISRRGGTVVKSMGDGFLATFESSSAALLAALDIQRVLAEDELAVRAGVHVGDVEHRGDDVTGITVNIAARVMDGAAPGSVIATTAAQQASLGAGLRYTELEPARLRGLDGTWTRFEVTRVPRVGA